MSFFFSQIVPTATVSKGLGGVDPASIATSKTTNGTGNPSTTSR